MFNDKLRFAFDDFVDEQAFMCEDFFNSGDLIDCEDEAKDEACRLFLSIMQSWCPDIMPYCVDSYGAAIDAIYSDKPNEFYYLLCDIHRQAAASNRGLCPEEKWDFGELFFDVQGALPFQDGDQVNDFDDHLRHAIYLYLESTLRELCDERHGYKYRVGRDYD